MFIAVFSQTEKKIDWLLSNNAIKKNSSFIFVILEQLSKIQAYFCQQSIISSRNKQVCYSNWKYIQFHIQVYEKGKQLLI